jgi:mRNA-degrading endonuclease RelE of RelBE toxin-antitoxin system
MSRQYSVVLTRTFQKDFKKLNPKIQQEVLLALKNLEKDPYDPNFHIRKLSGVKVECGECALGIIE